jgi:hypothetical protein
LRGLVCFVDMGRKAQQSSIYVSWTYFAFVNISNIYPRSGFCYFAQVKIFLASRCHCAPVSSSLVTSSTELRTFLSPDLQLALPSCNLILPISSADTIPWASLFESRRQQSRLNADEAAHRHPRSSPRNGTKARGRRNALYRAARGRPRSDRSRSKSYA